MTYRYRLDYTGRDDRGYLTDTLDIEVPEPVNTAELAPHAPAWERLTRIAQEHLTAAGSTTHVINVNRLTALTA